MYFDRVYHDDDAVTFDLNNSIVSSLLLQRYEMSFHNQTVGMSYIAGAATRKQHRGNGYMLQLLKSALFESFSRGDLFCSLIPAREWLYLYYEKVGFSTVFFIDPQRFTSLHKFSVSGNWSEYEDLFDDKVYNAMSDFEKMRKCTVLHSKRDYLNILDDLRLCNGRFVAIADADCTIRSLAWATLADDQVVVRDLLGDCDESRLAALSCLRTYYPDKAFIVWMPPLDNHRRLYPHGMARIVNAGACLKSIALDTPQWQSVIRIKDSIIAENNHIYIIKDGECIVDDSYTGNYDFDTEISTLNDIIFSSKKIGEILGFPSTRPFISLMLD